MFGQMNANHCSNSIRSRDGCVPAGAKNAGDGTPRSIMVFKHAYHLGKLHGQDRSAALELLQRLAASGSLR